MCEFGDDPQHIMMSFLGLCDICCYWKNDKWWFYFDTMETPIVLRQKTEPECLHVVKTAPCEQRWAPFMWHCGNVHRGLAAVNIVNRMWACQWGEGEGEGAGGRAGDREKLGRAVRKLTLDLQSPAICLYRHSEWVQGARVSVTHNCFLGCSKLLAY